MKLVRVWIGLLILQQFVYSGASNFEILLLRISDRSPHQVLNLAFGVRSPKSSSLAAFGACEAAAGLLRFLSSFSLSLMRFFNSVLDTLSPVTSSRCKFCKLVAFWVCCASAMTLVTLWSFVWGQLKFLEVKCFRSTGIMTPREAYLGVTMRPQWGNLWGASVNLCGVT